MISEEIADLNRRRNVTLTEMPDDLVRKVYKDAWNPKLRGYEVANKYQISQANVSLIKRGRVFTHVTGHEGDRVPYPAMERLAYQRGRSDAVQEMYDALDSIAKKR